MGNDSSNAAMLDALGALRQVTRMGVGVLAPHHCAKDASPPYEPRGGLRHPGRAGPVLVAWPACPAAPDPLHDPRRVLECVKSRFAELTPPPLRIERVDADPDAPRPRYGYRLLDGVQGKNVQDLAQTPAGVDALSEQQRRVLEALVRGGRPEGHHAGADGGDRAGAQPGAGGRPGADQGPPGRRRRRRRALAEGRAAPARYALTPWALEQLAAHGADPGPLPDPAVRLLHEALDPQPQGAPGGEAA